jgi:hypothetical protein
MALKDPYLLNRNQVCHLTDDAQYRLYTMRIPTQGTDRLLFLFPEAAFRTSIYLLSYCYKRVCKSLYLGGMTHEVLNQPKCASGPDAGEFLEHFPQRFHWRWQKSTLHSAKLRWDKFCQAIHAVCYDCA